MRKPLIACALVAIAATGASARTPRGAVPEATPTGPAIDCVQARSIRETRVHGDSTIDFHMLGGKVYRNTLPYSCPSLGFEERFSYKISTSELCSVDTITVLYSTPIQQGATCGLGKFQPVRLAHR